MWELKLEHLSRLRFMTRLRTLSDERQISQRLSDGIQNKRNCSSGVLLSETEERNKILLTRQNHSLNKSEVQKLCKKTFYFWIIEMFMLVRIPAITKTRFNKKYRMQNHLPKWVCLCYWLMTYLFLWRDHCRGTLKDRKIKDHLKKTKGKYHLLGCVRTSYKRGGGIKHSIHINKIYF